MQITKKGVLLMGKKRIQLDISDSGLKDLLTLKDQLYASTTADVIRSSIKN